MRSADPTSGLAAPHRGPGRIAWLLCAAVALLVGGAAPGDPTFLQPLATGSGALADAARLLAGQVDPGHLAVLGWLLLTGVATGFASGFFGIGGALITVPCLYALLPMLGVTPERLPYTVLGSSLCVMVPTALIASVSQWRHGALDWAWLGRLAPWMTLGAAAGAALALEIRGPVLALLFGLQSIYYGWGLMRGGVARAGSGRARLARAASRLPGWVAGPLVAAFCACAGMGTGSLLTPYLVLQQVDLRRAVATSGAINICVAVAGGAWFALAGAAPSAGGTSDGTSVCWTAVALIVAGACAAVPPGVALAHRVPVAVFRRLLGAVSIASASALLIHTFGG